MSETNASTAPEPPAMSPEELRAARRALGLTGEQLGAMLGFGARGRRTVSDMERAVIRPSETTLRLLRAYLDGYRPPDWPG